MTIFGKTPSEYFRFQKAIMILIVVVGLGRLGLSLAGLSVANVRWLSLTFVALVGIVYCAVQVPRSGFGTYRHLLPLFVMQAATGNFIIAGAIALSVFTGVENIYSAPEYSGVLASRQGLHALGHIADGIIIGPLLGWLIGSPVMLVVKKLAPGEPVGVAAAGSKNG